MKSPVFMDSMHEEDLVLLESHRGWDTSLSCVVPSYLLCTTMQGYCPFRAINQVIKSAFLSVAGLSTVQQRSGSDSYAFLGHLSLFSAHLQSSSGLDKVNHCPDGLHIRLPLVSWSI